MTQSHLFDNDDERIIERITPDAFQYVEDGFDAWCDQYKLPHRPWGAAAEDVDTRAWLREGDSWQRNRADRIVRFGKMTMLLVDIKTTTARNGHTGNLSLELRTLWAADMERPKQTIYAIWHEDAWWYMTPFEIMTDAIFSCCDDCWHCVQRHDYAALPAKCPTRIGRPGSGDPFVVVSMDHARPLDELRRGRML